MVKALNIDQKYAKDLDKLKIDYVKVSGGLVAYGDDEPKLKKAKIPYKAENMNVGRETEGYYFGEEVKMKYNERIKLLKEAAPIKFNAFDDNVKKMKAGVKSQNKKAALNFAHAVKNDLGGIISQIGRQMESVKKEALSPAAHKRIDGLVNLGSVKRLKDSITVLMKDITSEGFERREAREYLMNLVDEAIQR